MIRMRQRSVPVAQAAELSSSCQTEVRSTINSDRGDWQSNCRPDHGTNCKRAHCRHANAHRKNCLSIVAPAHRYLKQVHTNVENKVSIRVQSPLFWLYTVPQVVVKVSIPSTPPRPDAPQLMDEQFRDRFNAGRSTPFHICSRSGHSADFPRATSFRQLALSTHLFRFCLSSWS